MSVSDRCHLSRVTKGKRGSLVVCSFVKFCAGLTGYLPPWQHFAISLMLSIRDCNCQGGTMRAWRHEGVMVSSPIPNSDLEFGGGDVEWPS